MTRKLLEKEIEKKVGEYAKKLGCLYYKFCSPNQRAVPDRLIIAPNSNIGFLELKREGCKPTALQQLEMQKLKDKGCTVAWVDSVAAGKLFVDKLLRGEDWV